MGGTLTCLKRRPRGFLAESVVLDLGVPLVHYILGIHLQKERGGK